MAEVSKIEWCDSTFNPWIGCTKVSAACDHCYAETMSNRYGWVDWGSPGTEGTRKRTSVANWRKVLSWQFEARRFQLEHKRRRRVFCASLADWLDNQVPTEWRADLCRLIVDTPDLDWLLLTKRPQNLRKLVPSWAKRVPDNVWLGTTAEDAKSYRQRWPHYAKVQARVRFISYEPALGPLGPLDLGDGIVPDWIISGGESGGGARVTNPDWVRSVRSHCATHRVAFFHKQWGTYHSNPAVVEKPFFTLERAKNYDPPANGKGGALLDGQLYRAFPERRAA